MTTISRRIRQAATNVLVVASLIAGFAAFTRHVPNASWTRAEREMLRSLSLAALPPMPADPSNRFADDERAASLGHALFFDTRLSGNGAIACASCHLPDRNFQDDKPLAEGVGMTARRTMPIAAGAYSPWQFWDGRSDSQWAQALGPLESAVEHGGTRTAYAHIVAEHYREEYETVFGRMPDLTGLPRHAGPVADTAWAKAWLRIPASRRDEISRVYASIGKAIAAYERRISVGASRFDRYVDAELRGLPHTPASALTRDEIAGLRLFIGKGNCTTCHNGALLTDNHFHNTGIPFPSTALPPDSGRATGVGQALASEFSCTGPFSDAKPDQCEEARFAVTTGHELVRAYKTPSLRNVAERAPYMHAGQLATLSDVIAHYDAAPSAPYGHSELRPLRLTSAERRQLEAFLRTLTGPIVAPAAYLAPPTGRLGRARSTAGR